jgi:hypothetical protein
MEAVIQAPVAELQAMGEAGYQRVRSRHSVDFLGTRLGQLMEGSTVTHHAYAVDQAEAGRGVVP